MVTLPHSIEAALRDAGFSPTEILILNHLIEHEGMTLRELALKTGKSTGVLDQAMKKLLRRRIVERQMFNDTPKYVVQSLQSVIDWMEDDTQRRREEIDRRYTDFESYILTLERERSRPHVEYFDGFEGIKRAYGKLLEFDSKDLCGYVPARLKEEEDPLRDFKVQWFRSRYNGGVFLRILTEDTSLGRRFQSRDSFEYRKTLLLDPSRHPVHQEKYTINGVIMAIDYDKRTAILLHYPEMAKNEQEIFETQWRHAQVPEAANGESPKLAPVVLPPKQISLRTKVVSLFREFFVGPKSVIAIGLCLILFGAFGYFDYKRTADFSTWLIRDEAVAIAATGSANFDPDDVNQIRTKEDEGNPAYLRLLKNLNEIRSRNPDVAYAYIMRKTDKQNYFEYIADADAIDAGVKRDRNSDGVINEDDEPDYPGEIFIDTDVLPSSLYEQPFSFNPYYDPRWGTTISGWAPIKDASGKGIAILGVDIFDKKAQDLTQKNFAKVLYFLLILFVFLVIRIIALRPKLFKE